MESKKTFGEYIRERRRAMGLTQREFAEKLYVTESAVSKWERGMSYPDVTLLRDICAVLGVTEHELLTASEDTERRSADRLAAKYLRLTRNYRAALYILFGAVLLGCAIGNLAAQGTLSWFWIVLAAVGLAASPTLVPALAIMNPKTEGVKWHLAAASFLVWLELLLLICCLYTGGTWFPVAGVAVLFGAGLVLLPPLLPSLPGPEWLTGRKTALYLAVETALLLLLLLVCVLSYGGTWFPGAAMGCVFGLSLIFVPVFLRQLPLPPFFRDKKLTLYLAVETALFLLLLLVCQMAYGGDWFPVAAVSVLFGLGLLFLPVVLCQLPLGPLEDHKALLYFAVETVLLFAILAASAWTAGEGWFFPQGVPLALIGLALPWGLLGIIRYLPVNRWFKGSLSCAWTGLWLWLAPWCVETVLALNGSVSSFPYRLALPFDFSNWGSTVVAVGDGRVVSYAVGAWNVFAIILLSLGGLALVLAAAGVWSIRRRRRD